MRNTSEAKRQIIEFEELVKRLDRINDLRDTTSNTNHNNSPSHRTSNTLVASYTCSPNRSSPYARQDGPSSYPKCCREDSKRVQVNIGIDDDLRMILEMDPSIVDRQVSDASPQTVCQQDQAEGPQQSPNEPHHSTMVNSRTSDIARPPRARPQGWYWRLTLVPNNVRLFIITFLYLAACATSRRRPFSTTLFELLF